jgi:4-hydroxybenzoate polyprenyltransferase
VIGYYHDALGIPLTPTVIAAAPAALALWWQSPDQEGKIPKRVLVFGSIGLLGVLAFVMIGLALRSGE